MGDKEIAVELARVADAVNNVRTDVGRLYELSSANKQCMARIDERHKILADQLNEVRTAVITGNGQPALKQQVTTLTLKMEHVEGDVEEMRSTREAQAMGRNLSRTQIIIAAVTLLGTFLTAAVALAVGLTGALSS